MRRLAPWLVLSFLICSACGDGKSNMDSSLGTAGAGGVGPGGVSGSGGGGPVSGSGGGGPVSGSGGGGALGGAATGGGPEDTGESRPVMAIEERLPGAFVCAPENTLRDLGESDGDVTRLLPVDINKDGLDDLLIGSMSDGGSSNPLDGFGVRLLLSGTSGFTLSSELGMPCGGGASECGLDMVVEDHDKDGNLDVIAVSPTWRKLMVYLGDGEGNFSQLGDDLQIEVNPADYHFFDVDIDGDSDLVATMAQGCEEDQATVSAADYCVGSSQCTGDLVCRHSFLGGGSDLCLPRPCAGFQVLENHGGGSFSLGVLQTISMDAVGQPQVGDVNGDGVLDGYVVSPDVRWYRASSAGFEPAAAVVLHGFRYSKAFDIDNDGRDELIVGGYVLWSDANGHFTRATQHSFQTNSERLAAFRIDDTHTLVASNGEVGEQWTVGVSIFEGTQLKKHFDLCATIVSSDAIGTVAAADIDGDGTRELVVGGLKKDMLQVYEGAFSD